MRRLCAALVLLCCVVITGEATAGDVAVIVHKENATREVSFGELVKLSKHERQFWEGGKRVYLILRETGAAEKQVILKKIYKMDARALKKFWLGKLYRGDIPAYPKTLASDEAIARFVSQVPNAMGFIDAVHLDDRVQALRIDGRLPGDPGYALKGDF